MNIDSLQRIILSVARSRGLNAVLQTMVRGLAEQSEVALARIWLVAPGDICASCHVRSVCPDQTRCLHLFASAGNPLSETGSVEGTPESWTRIDGHFRRLPLNATSKVNHVGGTGQSVLLQVGEDLEKEMWVARPDWVKAQRIRSFAGQPLIFQEEVLGVLGVFSRAHLNEHQFGWLRAFADHAAAAITNIQATEHIKVLNAQLTVTAERNRTLLEINNAIITNLTQEALLQSIAKALRRVISFDRSAITLYRPDRGTFRFLAVEGHLLSDYFKTGLEVVHEETNVGWVFDHQQPLVRRDLEKEHQFANERRLSAEGIQSMCVAPLIFLGKSIGTLSLVSLSKDQYSEADAAFLQEVANQVALAVVNMNSYEEIATLNKTVARTADQLRTLLEINNAIITNLSEEALLRSFSEAVRRVVPFDRAALTLYLPAKDAFRYLAVESRLASEHFRPGLEFKPTESISGWVFDNQRAVVRRDLEKEQQYWNDRRLIAEGLRSDCIVPLTVRGRSIGTLNVGSTTTNQYSEADAEFLQEVANQVALAVENTRSYEEIAALKARLEKENIYLQEEIRTAHHFEEIVGSNPALLAALRKVEQVAPTDSTVLIKGETGTGKELIARAIHDRSARRHRPLVRVDCGVFSAGLVESELFGHVKGAFTGALEKRIGRFELADGGTIFLDEVGELPSETQVKLLRVLQEHEFELVGSSHPVRVDVRVIAATNRNLEEDVRTGRFRSDLFYRLNVFPLEIPPLRDRRSDIPLLVMFYLTRFCRKLGKKVESVAQETMNHLADYPWPGNVRELQNVVERAVVLSQGPILQLDEDFLPVLVSGRGPQMADVRSMAPPARHAPLGLATLEEVERGHILAALRETGGVIEGPRGAARILKLHPNTLRHRMEKLGIKRSGHRLS